MSHQPTTWLSLSAMNWMSLFAIMSVTNAVTSFIGGASVKTNI